jgi:protein-S-isoprenylcysteine O-methyltransferase Ste14
MSYEGVRRATALIAIVPACASLYFPVFWLGFGFWRRHRALTYTFMLGTVYGTAAAVYVWRAPLLSPAIEVPAAVQALGWAVVLAALGLGTIADRQIGLRVRAFTPFFEEAGRIRLITTGAYGVVRHPIYAAGVWFQLGAFLVSGALAVAAAGAVLAVGACWFTRQEERRLLALLEDPAAYAQYRARVPALIPWPRRR